MKLILASTSPFRKAILEKLGVEFETAKPDADESIMPGETAESLVARLAELKARAVADNMNDALVIGSDQVAVIGSQVLGKPGNHDNAVKQLQDASGRVVTFYTGLCLVNTDTGNIQSKVVPFKVHFRELTDEQIENYLQKEQPYNCAGSFKSEALGITLFRRLEGDDPNTLMGLPLIDLVHMLENENFRVI